MTPLIDASVGSSAQRPHGWFVVWTESRAEKRVAARVAAKGFESWLPTVIERHRWSDRWQRVVLPLFPGYLFTRCLPGELSSVLATPGVLTVVKTGSRPTLLADDYIRRLRQAVESPETHAATVEEAPVFSANEEVLVRDGPLAGLRGVVRELRGNRRLVIWIAAVGRGVAFTLDSSMLARA